MSAYDLIANRHSIGPGLQTDDALSGAELDRLFAAAMSAPDHGALRPYRFLCIRGAARERLGQVFAEAARRRGEDAAAAEKARRKPLRSPVLLAVIASVTPDHPKAPRVEQLLTAGMAGYNVMLAAQAEGLAAIWLSGVAVYDEHVIGALGVGENETLLGFIYLGHPKRRVSAPRRADWREHVREWAGD